MSDKSLKRYKILVTEDDEFIYYLLKDILADLGADCVWAKNGSEALNLLEQRKDIDLILMDINMPEMDGITATRKIRERKINIPIIFQTACNHERRNECREAGGNEYLCKPIRVEVLCKVLNKYLNGIRL
jgi:CheY-like chemotaxis protein